MQLVRTVEQLPTIKVSLSFGETDDERYSPAVDFEVGVGREVLHRFTVDPAALGIPEGFDPGSYRQDEPEFLLTGAVTSQLTGPVRRALREEDEEEDVVILWLQLASPIGYLAALPWERMLKPVFPHVPVLRIPDFALAPELGEGPVDIVVCVSEPGVEPRQPAVRILDGFLDGPALDLLDATAHVFADLPTYRLLSDQRRPAPRIVLHDPRRAGQNSDSAARQRTAGGKPVTDPWLAWLVEEMRGTTVEAVHFITHGDATGGQPALAVAESPTRHDDRLWARFIGPDQLAGCLTQLGAWSVGFSSPPGNLSPLGLREFADSVARLRPGPVLYHDAGNGPAEYPAGALLGRAYWSLFTGRRPALSPGSFMYVHPRLLGVPGAPAYAESLVEQAMGRPARPGAVPPWETMTRRLLEQSTAQMFPDQAGPASAEQEAVGEGVRQALRFVNQVLDEHGGLQA